MQDTTIGSQSEDFDDHDLSLQDTQPNTVCTDLHPIQPQLHSLDIGTASSSSQLNAELCIESAASHVSLTEDLDIQPDTVDPLPVQSQLHGLDAEDSGTGYTQLVNAELYHEPTMRVSSMPVLQPHDLSSPDVASIVSRCAQVEQENSELRAENLALKQKLETLNSTVQRLSLSLLTDCQVNVYWLLVMTKLRYNFPQNDLACRFNVEQSSVSRILNQWIPMLKVQLKLLIRWPQTTIGPIDPPYNLLPNAVDGTEIFIEFY